MTLRAKGMTVSGFIHAPQLKGVSKRGLDRNVARGGP